MDESKAVFEVLCPCCRAVLWVDAASQDVVKSERSAGRERSSLDDLLVKEKHRREGFERKFEATAELEKQKQLKARETFERAITAGGSEDGEEEDQGE